MSEKVPENIAFIPRGTAERTIDFFGYQFQIKIDVLNNREHNELLEKHSYTDELEGTFKINVENLVEDRIINHLHDINTTFNGKEWQTLSESEKEQAVLSMHPQLREKINDEIIARSTLTEEERDFL